MDLQKTVREALAAFGPTDPDCIPDYRMLLLADEWDVGMAELFANAPTWLAAQADEIERLRSALDDLADDFESANPRNHYSYQSWVTALRVLHPDQFALKPAPAEVAQ